jgi:hypothetical protein
MIFLRDKLLADLAEPVKTFVYKSAARALTELELDALRNAIGSYGPGALLCAFPADADNPAGSVREHAPNITIGYFDFSGGEDTQSRFAAWRALCRTVVTRRTCPATVQ